VSPIAPGCAWRNPGYARDVCAGGRAMTQNSDTNPLVRVRNLEVSFRIDRHVVFEAVKGVSFDIPRDTTVALVGESGSGKSVTALAILGLLPPENSIIDAGSEIVFGGRNVLQLPAQELRQMRGADISMIFQEPMTSLNPVFTVGFQLTEVLRLHMGMTPAQARKRAIELLDEVGIPDPEYKINAYPSQMSGGQQQRVMIAMAIACEPKLLIADEPTTALDVTIQKQILDLIAALQKKRRMSVLFITHDLAVVGEIADYVVVMRDGEIREQGSAHQVFENSQDPYTQALLKCRPQLDRRPVRLPVIDDYMGGRTQGSRDMSERRRGVRPEDPIVLEVNNLGKNFYSREGLFGKRKFEAVKNVSFRLPKGKTLGLVGESGSGKTTVGLTLMRLHEASSGEAIFEGRDLLAMSPKDFMAYKRRIQIIFQNPYASLNPRFIVGQVLTEPMDIHGIGNGALERTELAFELLHKVGLPEASFYKYPHEFSGGQRQRIAIARCLTMKPDILICDESVSALDVSVQAQVLNLLQDLQDEYRLSYIFISHDLAVVKYISDQIMVMNNGEIVEIADSDEIYRNPRQPYTQRLLASIPKGWRAGSVRAAVLG
jgi:peptide/nickel transport system ATP-binding protein